MACSDGEVSRGRANQVSMRCGEVLDAIYQVSIDLRRWLGLHGVVSIWLLPGTHSPKTHPNMVYSAKIFGRSSEDTKVTLREVSAPPSGPVDAEKAKRAFGLFRLKKPDEKWCCKKSMGLACLRAPGASTRISGRPGNFRCR
jgi:hypothetical protein